MASGNAMRLGRGTVYADAAPCSDRYGKLARVEQLSKGTEIEREGAVCPRAVGAPPRIFREDECINV